MQSTKFIFAAALLFCSLTIFAQRPGRGDGDRPGKEKIENLRIAYITKELNLTTEEAQQFWPLYNEYRDKLQDSREGGIKGNFKDEDAFDDMSDADIEKVMLQRIDRQAKEAEVQREYFFKFKKVISVKKIARLVRAEKEFMKILRDRIEERRERAEKPERPERPERPEKPERPERKEKSDDRGY